MNLDLTANTLHMAPACLPVYRAIIDHIVTTGSAPTDDAIAARTALPLDEVAALRTTLAEQDWLAQDAGGTLTSIYPFALNPTGITVALDGVTRHAQCAIDALGVSAMLDRPVPIEGSCAECGAPIAIITTPNGLQAWSPDGIVVTARYASGPALRTRCHVMRFACSTDHGRRWLTTHGAPDDVILPVEQAFALARRQFAACYSHGHRVKPFDTLFRN